MKALFDTLTPGDKEWQLAAALDPARLPAHIAIIMDGNGRWASRRHLPRVAGHRAGRGARPLDGRNLRPPRHRRTHPLRLLLRELEAPTRGSRDALAASPLLPAQGTARSQQERHPAARHRPRGCAAGRGARRASGGSRGYRRQSRPAREPGHQLRRPQRDRGRRQRRRSTPPAPEGRLDALRLDEAGHFLPPLHLRLARSRPAHPHLRRDAHQQLPALADRLRGDLRHAHAVARFHPHGPACRPSWITRSATAATAG